MPTEAQWEYACRAGTTTPFYFGDSLSSKQTNFDGNYPYGNAEKGEYKAKTTKVASYDENAFGLYDMHGNLWEWCAETYIRTILLSITFAGFTGYISSTWTITFHLFH